MVAAVAEVLAAAAEAAIVAAELNYDIAPLVHCAMFCTSSYSRNYIDYPLQKRVCTAASSGSTSGACIANSGYAYTDIVI